MMLRGSIRNFSVKSAQVGPVQLLITDASGKLLHEVIVNGRYIGRGGATPFSVRFAMSEPPVGPVRVKLGQSLVN